MNAVCDDRREELCLRPPVPIRGESLQSHFHKWGSAPIADGSHPHFENEFYDHAHSHR